MATKRTSSSKKTAVERDKHGRGVTHRSKNVGDDQISSQIARRKEALLQVLNKTLGNITAACKVVGINRATFYNYVRADPDFAAAVKEVDEVCLDAAVDSLFQQMREGNAKATIFYLEKKGRSRGFGETPIDVNVNVSEDARVQATALALLEELRRRAWSYEAAAAFIAEKYGPKALPSADMPDNNYVEGELVN